MSAYEFDVFLSHSSKDKTTVRLIADALKNAGLKVWFDEWEIKPGDSIPLKVDEGLENSKVLVLCMSENAFDSDWAQLESYTARFKDPLNRERRFVPLKLDDVEIKASLKQFSYIDYHASDAINRLIAACGGGTTTFAATSHADKKWNIPESTRHFTGQEAVLENITKHKRTSLSGFGGIGKTQVALQYAALHKNQHGAGLFIVATSKSSVDMELAKFVKEDLLDDVQDETVQHFKTQAIKHLKETEDPLVILDNVDEWVKTDEFNKLVSLLANVKLIITCRYDNVDEQFQVIPVNEMDDETGARFMLSLAGRNEPYGTEFDDAKVLSKQLDGLPLALHHAGAIMSEEKKSAHEVLAEYHDNRERLLRNRNRRAPANYPESAFVMIARAYEKLSPAAQELVSCCAFLPPHRIREIWFTDGFFIVGKTLAQKMPRFSDVRTEALHSTLLQRDYMAQTLSIHRITQAVIQERMKATNPDEIERRLKSILNECVVAHRDKGHYRDSVEVAEYSREEHTLLLGSQHVDTLMSMNDLAVTYSSMGRHQEALELEEKTLGLRTSTLGENHPDTLTSMGNLASTYSSMGRHQEALQLHKKTLDLRQSVLGETHPHTLTSMGNLASAYGSLGRHQEALQLHKKTLDLRKSALGENHPETLTSMNNLALTYADLGSLEEAILLMTEAVRGLTSVLGEEHPDTKKSRANLDVMLAEQKRQNRESKGRFGKRLPPGK